MLSRGWGAAPSRNGAFVPTLAGPPGAAVREPSALIRNVFTVFPPAVPASVPTSTNRNRPSGDTSVWLASVPTGNETVELGIGVSAPFGPMSNPVTLGALVPGWLLAASPRLATYRRSPAIPMLSGWSPPDANTPTRSSRPFGRTRNDDTESLPWLTANRNLPSAVTRTCWSPSSGPTALGMFSCPVPPVANDPNWVRLPSGLRWNPRTAFWPGVG